MATAYPQRYSSRSSPRAAAAAPAPTPARLRLHPTKCAALTASGGAPAVARAWQAHPKSTSMIWMHRCRTYKLGRAPSRSVWILPLASQLKDGLICATPTSIRSPPVGCRRRCAAFDQYEETDSGGGRRRGGLSQARLPASQDERAPPQRRARGGAGGGAGGGGAARVGGGSTSAAELSARRGGGASEGGARLLMYTRKCRCVNVYGCVPLTTVASKHLRRESGFTRRTSVPEPSAAPGSSRAPSRASRSA